jgi:hypothetical protein
MKRIAFLLLTFIAAAAAQPKRVLLVNHSAGFRHDSVVVAAQVLEALGRQSGVYEVVSTEDLSLISEARLGEFDALFFFTSGELALSDEQKAAILEFVRAGKGFGGAHSATDTLYGWPAYGEMIGAYFDGHPWVQNVGINVEDDGHPAAKPVAPRFEIVDEIYQFRSFSRDRVRVLMTLDTSTVDLNAPGVNRTDGDFALAWCRAYGEGRVFYTALGHFDETWRDSRFQSILDGALRYLTGLANADCTPRRVAESPRIATGGVVNAATYSADGVSPGAVVSIFGTNLTSGASMASAPGNWPSTMAGAQVLWNDTVVPLLYAAPGQINAQLPYSLRPGETGRLKVVVLGRLSNDVPLEVQTATPGVLAVTSRPGVLSVYCVGLGAVDPPVEAGAPAPDTPLARTVSTPEVLVNGNPARIFFSGLAPGWTGLYQIDVEDVSDGSATLEVVVRIT